MSSHYCSVLLKQLLKVALLASVSFLTVAVSAEEGALESAEVKRLNWKVFQADTEYRADKDEKSKFNLLYAYENLAQVICMPDLLKTFQFAGKPEGEPCLEVLGKIESLGEPSLVQDCIENGIAAESCKEGYAKQIALPFSSLPSALVDDSERESEKGLTKEFEAAKLRYKKSRSLEDLRKFMGAVRPDLLKSCENSSIRLVLPSSLPQSHAEYFQDEEDEEQNKVGALLKELEGEKVKEEGVFAAQPEPTKKDPRVRVRALSDRCLELIEAVLEAHPLSSLAICERDGGHSLPCLSAIRQERRFLSELKSKPIPQAPGSKRQNAPEGKGFSTF